MDNKQARADLKTVMREVNKKMGHKSAFSNMTPTYREWKGNIKDGFYKDHTPAEWKRELDLFRDSYMNDMFPKESKNKFNQQMKNATDKGKEYSRKNPNSKNLPDNKRYKGPLSK